jgi:hypothetical protein
MKKNELAVLFLMPPMFLVQASLSLSMMQTGGFLDFLRPVMPFFSAIVNFFGNLLIPLGQFFGTWLQGPLTTLSTMIPARSVTGYALYFIVFAGIFLIALYLNVVWRPLGYATADSRAKREEKEARWAEKEAAKDEAKAKRKALKEKPSIEKPVSVEPSVEKPASAEPSTEKTTSNASPSPGVVEIKETFVDKPGENSNKDDAKTEKSEGGKGPDK